MKDCFHKLLQKEGVGSQVQVISSRVLWQPGDTRAEPLDEPQISMVSWYSPSVREVHPWHIRLPSCLGGFENPLRLAEELFFFIEDFINKKPVNLRKTHGDINNMVFDDMWAWLMFDDISVWFKHLEILRNTQSLGMQ